MDGSTHALREKIDGIRELLERFHVEDHLIATKGDPRQGLEPQVARDNRAW